MIGCAFLKVVVEDHYKSKRQGCNPSKRDLHNQLGVYLKAKESEGMFLCDICQEGGAAGMSRAQPAWGMAAGPVGAAGGPLSAAVAAVAGVGRTPTARTGSSVRTRIMT